GRGGSLDEGPCSFARLRWRYRSGREVARPLLGTSARGAPPQRRGGPQAERAKRTPYQITSDLGRPRQPTRLCRPGLSTLPSEQARRGRFHPHEQCSPWPRNEVAVAENSTHNVSSRDRGLGADSLLDRR